MSCVFCVLRKRECVCVMCVFEVNEVLLYEKRTHVKVCVCVVCCGSVRVSACVCRTPVIFVSSLKPMKFYCMRREHVIYINICVYFVCCGSVRVFVAPVMFYCMRREHTHIYI